MAFYPVGARGLDETVFPCFTKQGIRTHEKSTWILQQFPDMPCMHKHESSHPKTVGEREREIRSSTKQCLSDNRTVTVNNNRYTENPHLYMKSRQHIIWSITKLQQHPDATNRNIFHAEKTNMNILRLQDLTPMQKMPRVAKAGVPNNYRRARSQIPTKDLLARMYTQDYKLRSARWKGDAPTAGSNYYVYQQNYQTCQQCSAMTSKQKCNQSQWKHKFLGKAIKRASRSYYQGYSQNHHSLIWQTWSAKVEWSRSSIFWAALKRSD